eukprot:Blabericola_migrator_1__7484@NODE_381_length_9180_cov_88_545814_g304_i0_p7_GENE_NODE_381_length_9180_cov_88_545814_g304_i0NODE_381_length_9180_cov_88_545814_g304_i0_p7_ORF_typecomplete_len150_score31_99HSCB_C/PF07743_13/0_0033_NODE_381_length_9180_cov_88_545814_g304_i040284477
MHHKYMNHQDMMPQHSADERAFVMGADSLNADSPPSLTPRSSNLTRQVTGLIWRYGMGQLNSVTFLNLLSSLHAGDSVFLEETLHRAEQFRDLQRSEEELVQVQQEVKDARAALRPQFEEAFLLKTLWRMSSLQAELESIQASYGDSSV